MENVLTPEPHFTPGYGGHCPGYNHRFGVSYGRLTHNVLNSPCVPHSKDINLTEIHRLKDGEYPTQEEFKALDDRQKYVEAVYRHPIIPGYMGYVPRIKFQIGKRFLADATAGVAEHELFSERMRCERRHIQHLNVLESSGGMQETHIGERLMPTTKYRTPLLPTTGKSCGHKIPTDCIAKKPKETYTKFTTPHYMDNDDDEKWIISSYAGHIPRDRFLFALFNRKQTNMALNEYSDNLRRYRLKDFCPDIEVKPQYYGCSEADCQIYRSNSGIMANYGGHVPGRNFRVGKNNATATRDAKSWLLQNTKSNQH